MLKTNVKIVFFFISSTMFNIAFSFYSEAVIITVPGIASNAVKILAIINLSNYSSHLTASSLYIFVEKKITLVVHLFPFCGLLCRCRIYMTPSALLYLYKNPITPKIKYCCYIMNVVTQSLLSSLHRVQVRLYGFVGGGDLFSTRHSPYPQTQAYRY